MALDYKHYTLEEVRTYVIENVIKNNFNGGKYDYKWDNFAMFQLMNFFNMLKDTRFSWINVDLDAEICPFERVFVCLPYKGISINISSGFGSVSVCYYDSNTKSLSELRRDYEKENDNDFNDDMAKELETEYRDKYIDFIKDSFSEYFSSVSPSFQFANLLNHNGTMTTTKDFDVVCEEG